MNPTLKNNPWVFTTFILAAYVVLSQFYDIGIVPKSATQSNSTGTQSGTNNLASVQSASIDVSDLRAAVIPQDGVELPIKWGDLGKRMVKTGVVDANKLRQLFGGKLSEDQEKMLTGTWDDKMILTEENSRFLLDMLWAFGLGNKNEILEEGEMVDEKYGGAGNFAATGGWSLAKGDPMNHYSKYAFVKLTKAQQILVDEVSKGTYRPCCGNSTHFPDCNHGMAMLGLLELMAAEGVSKEDMYKAALAVNSVWFPQTYMDLAAYFKEQGQEWNEVDAAVVLGQEYSSAQGYQATRAKIQSLPQVKQGGGGCGA